MIPGFRTLSPQTLRLLALFQALLATVLFLSTQIEGYLSARMFNRIATSAAVVLPIAVGQAIVIMTRNIDLSAGSILGVVAYMTGQALGAMPGLHPVLAVLLAMGIGGLAGVINGVIVAYGRVPSIIVTQPVRSGQSLVFLEGDVTIVGSVASGAEIVAGGSIHVYGTLRGRAMAGTMGNAAARIFCRKLEAELIAIDGYYKTAEDMGPEFRGKPVQIWLDGEAFKVEALA